MTLSRISTHAPLAGRDMPPKRRNQHENISTHAPLAGRDAAASSLLPFFFDFNPRAPCGARPRGQPAGARLNDISTPRARCGARRACAGALLRAAQDFNPRAPCGARRKAITVREEMTSVFQPTRPLRGATRGQGRGVGRRKFQPTRPLRGATGADCTGRRTTTISTHAPLAGRDLQNSLISESEHYFNPRAPCGARRAFRTGLSMTADFNPRAPCGARRSGLRSVSRS